ncbi:MAG TPA: hypothetical protein VGL94_22615 [Ktedonobacteraceae bacterium]|jgi:hypothetical protein
MRTYTFNECYELLTVDPKTFRGWLKEADIDPNHQVSRADRRIRFLTQEQIDRLAVDHGRLLRAPSSDAHEVVSPGAFKLLLDRVQRTEEEIVRQEHLIEEATEHRKDLATKLAEGLQEYQNSLDKRITELVLASTKEFNELKAQLQATQQKVDQMAETFLAQIGQMNADLLDTRGQMKQWQQQQEAHNTDQTTLFGTFEASLASIQAQQNDLQQQLSTRALDQARDSASLQNQLRKADEELTSKITALAASASTAKAAVVEIQQRADRQEHRLTELFRLFAEEITTRQAHTDTRDGQEISEDVEKSPIHSRKLGELHQQVEEPQ